MTSANLKTLQNNLLAWFDANRRLLPWRVNSNLYGIWVSEIMLQQTTVKAVVPFWEKFMKQFPDVQALATADEASVLACWSGLGYYRRARNLHSAACRIVEEHGGILPGSRMQWSELPGVGTYASGAIASIGLGEVVPAIDANARRVICRLLFDDPVEAGNLRPAALEKAGSSLVCPERPGDWNEAVMELGATLCRADSVQCSQCPVLDQCEAGLAGVALEIPPRTKKEPAVPVVMAALVVRRGSQILLLPPGSPQQVPLKGKWDLARKDISGLHQGLWTVPVSPWYQGTEAASRALEKTDYIYLWLKRYFQLNVPADKFIALRMASFKHSITRYRLEIKTWEVQINEDWVVDEPNGPLGWSFVGMKVDQPVSKLVSKSLEMFGLRNV